MKTLEDVRRAIRDRAVNLEAWWGDELQCEGEYHPSGQFGHIAGQPASFLLLCPKCPTRFAVCDGRVRFLLGSEGCPVRCEGCGFVEYTPRVLFIPI